METHGWPFSSQCELRTILPEDYANQYSLYYIAQLCSLDNYLQNIDFSQKITDYYALTDYASSPIKKLAMSSKLYRDSSIWE